MPCVAARVFWFSFDPDLGGWQPGFLRSVSSGQAWALFVGALALPLPVGAPVVAAEPCVLTAGGFWPTLLLAASPIFPAAAGWHPFFFGSVSTQAPTFAVAAAAPAPAG